MNDIRILLFWLIMRNYFITLLPPPHVNFWASHIVGIRTQNKIRISTNSGIFRMNVVKNGSSPSKELSIHYTMMYLIKIVQKFKLFTIIQTIFSFDLSHLKFTIPHWSKYPKLWIESSSFPYFRILFRGIRWYLLVCHIKSGFNPIYSSETSSNAI